MDISVMWFDYPFAHYGLVMSYGEIILGPQLM